MTFAGAGDAGERGSASTFRRFIYPSCLTPDQVGLSAYFGDLTNQTALTFALFWPFSPFLFFLYLGQSVDEKASLH